MSRCNGSAPDIAGRGLANPIAMIGSFAMALRYFARASATPPTCSTAPSPTCSPRACGTADIAKAGENTVLHQGDGRRDHRGAERPHGVNGAPVETTGNASEPTLRGVFPSRRRAPRRHSTTNGTAVGHHVVPSARRPRQVEQVPGAGSPRRDDLDRPFAVRIEALVVADIVDPTAARHIGHHVEGPRRVRPARSFGARPGFIRGGTCENAVPVTVIGRRASTRFSSVASTSRNS